MDELEVVVVEVVDEFENDVLPVLFVAGGDDLVFDGLISVLLFSAFMPMKRSPAKPPPQTSTTCLLYTSDAADERSSVDLGGRRIINKKTNADRVESGTQEK